MLTAPAGRHLSHCAVAGVRDIDIADARRPCRSGSSNPEAKVKTVGVPAGVPDTVTGMLNVPAHHAHGLAAGAELHRRRLVMVRVLTDGLPRTRPRVGVPRVNVSVRLGPRSERSVPVMSWVCLPDPRRSADWH